MSNDERAPTMARLCHALNTEDLDALEAWLDDYRALADAHVAEQRDWRDAYREAEAGAREISSAP